MALTKKSALKLLGLSDSASSEEIKKAYRKLAMKHHPDREGGDEAQFKKIKEAFDYLEGGTVEEPRMTREAYEDVFANFRANRNQARVKFSSNVVVTLQEALEGGKKKIQIDAVGPTPYLIDIPKGCFPGMVLRSIVATDPNGIEITVDVVATINVAEYKITWPTVPQLYSGGIEGSGDIEKMIKVDWLTILEGGHIKYETIDGGLLEVRVAAGTEAGTRLKLKGRGLWKDLHLSARGDVYLRVQPDIPKLNNMTTEQLEKAISIFSSALEKATT